MAHRPFDHGPTRCPRPLLVLLVATLAAITLTVTVGATPTFAAEDPLRESVSTTYRVDPAGGVVHVTLDITATNLKPDTAQTIYYYNTLGFDLQVGARAVAATSGGRTLAVKTTAKDDYTDVTIRIPNLYHNQTRKVRLTYDLPGARPRSANPTRIGRAHAEFSAWAWGDAERADIRIIFPATFTGDVDVRPDEKQDPVFSTISGGLATYTAKGIARPTEWYAVINVSDASALTDVRLDIGGKQVSIHAWPEDEAWLDKVSTVLKEAFPALEATIDRPWPVSGELVVTEVSSGEIAGYAGSYDSIDEEIQISEDLDEHVIVHEAAHAWFNRGMFAQRWITEGLADAYAASVVAALNDGKPLDPEPVGPFDRVAFRLNAWPPPSRIDDDTSKSEAYGYDASWTVMRDLVNEMTEARMRDVFDAAAAETLTYVGAGPAETSDLSRDWRGFLDLTEDVGGSTEATALFEKWVVTTTEKPELAARATARARYKALVETGGDWLPGIVIRKPMGGWKFKDAEGAMASAETVVADRDGLRAIVTELGLAFPAALEPAYELADSSDDLAALDARIADWVTATASLRAARDALAVEREPLVVLGLYGSQPDAGYASGLSAWAAGDDAGAVSGSAATMAALAGAAEIGRSRAIQAGLAVIVAMLVVLLVAIVATWLVSRYRRRAPVAAAPLALAVGSAGEAAAGGTDSYATLAATPDPVEGAEVGGDGGEGAQPD